MFAHHCTACDARHLIFQSQVTSLTDVGGGFALTYQCWCGAEQVWLANADSSELAEAAA